MRTTSVSYIPQAATRRHLGTAKKYEGFIWEGGFIVREQVDT